MKVKALYHDGNLAELADFITENLATQFGADLENAEDVKIDVVKEIGNKGVYLFQVK